MLSDEILENSPRRPSRRRLWWTLGIAGALFIAALALVIYSDAEPPDVAELTVVALEIPERENFYLRMVEIEEQLKKDGGIVPNSEPDDLPADSPLRMPESGGSQSMYDNFAEFLASGRGWTPWRLARWDMRLARLVADCEELATLKRSQVPVLTEAWSRPVAPSQVGTELCAAAGMYLQAGNTRRAMEIFILTYDLGEKIKASRGPISVYSAGVDIQRMAIRSLERLLAQEPSLASQLFRWWQRKRGGEPPAYLADALRIEYSEFSFDVDAIKEGAVNLPLPAVFRFCYKTKVFFPLVLKPNLTKAIYAGRLRQQIAWRDLPSGEFKQRDSVDREPLAVPNLFRPVNMYGRYILEASDAPAFVIWWRARHRSEVSVFETSLALRLYHAEQGTLPASLDELVPAYFPSVPLDYQDGAPIRYSREARAVWSVGGNNLQIVRVDQTVDRNEICCRLDFAAPAASAMPPAAP